MQSKNDNTMLQVRLDIKLSAVEGTIARLISQSDATAVKQHELVTSQYQLVSSQQHLVLKADQLVTKQDQLHSAFVGDAVTPPMSSPPALSLLAWFGGMKDGTRARPQSVVSSKPVESFHTASDSLVYNCDTVFTDFRYGDLFEDNTGIPLVDLSYTENLAPSAHQQVSAIFDLPASAVDPPAEPAAVDPPTEPVLVSSFDSPPEHVLVSAINPPPKPPHQLPQTASVQLPPQHAVHSQQPQSQTASVQLPPHHAPVLSQQSQSQTAAVQLPPHAPVLSQQSQSQALGHTLPNLDDRARTVALSLHSKKDQRMAVEKASCVLARTVYFGHPVLKRALCGGRVILKHSIRSWWNT